MRAIHDVPAPAKLNLFLHITGRRADGMHELQSAFMLVDWCDTLHFEKVEGSGVTREDLGDPLPADDLVVKAARALQRASGHPGGAHIAIDKRLPAQAGMGGGSSDAASTLLALNRLWGLGWSASRLTALGVTLGADVPFFLFGRNAWVEGIGERLTPIDLPAGRFLVAKPREGVETARIFQDPQLQRSSEAAIITGFAANPYGFGLNVMQPVAERLCPGVPQALEWLGTKGLKGRMTGSGSAVFAHVPHGMPAVNLERGAPDGWQVRVCGNLAAHPLAGWASSDD